jgi:hypothetical protein
MAAAVERGAGSLRPEARRINWKMLLAIVAWISEVLAC